MNSLVYLLLGFVIGAMTSVIIIATLIKDDIDEVDNDK